MVEPEPDRFLLLALDYSEKRTLHRFFYIDATCDEPSMRHFSFELLNLRDDDMRMLASKAGIDDYTLYGDKDLTPYAPEESERLIFVARKSPGE